jgi:Rad3-related DNA helicase
MEDVWNAYQKCKDPTVVSIIQGANMSESERESFLEEFEKQRESGLVGFCVLGGIFSEGIDLTEDRLIGAIIVGTGLPQVCNEREILKNYFEAREENGFAYAYLYPGMNKVQQAAGRVIRTEQDKGIIALLDERFFGRQYQETFPREWKDVEMCNIHNVQEKIKRFYEEE